MTQHNVSEGTAIDNGSYHMRRAGLLPLGSLKMPEPFD